MPRREAGIYARSGGWSCTWEEPRDANGKRRQRSRSGFTTQKEAIAYRREQLRRIETGSYVEPSKLTVGDYLARWLKEAVQPKRANTTHDTYESIIRRHLLPAWGGILLTRLTPLVIDGYFNAKRESGLSAATIRLHWALLHKSLSQAVRWRLLVANPCASCDPPASPKRKPQCPSARDGLKLLEACEEPWLRCALTILLYSGIRRGECLGLRWGDVELGSSSAVLALHQQVIRSGRPQIVPRLKNKKEGRRIHVGVEVADELRRWKAIQSQERLLTGRWAAHDLILAGSGGEPRNPQQLTDGVKRVSRQAGLEIRGPHGLRHLQVSLLLTSGVPVHEVAERIGDTVQVVMETYAHLMPQRGETIGARVGGLLRGAG